MAWGNKNLLRKIKIGDAQSEGDEAKLVCPVGFTVSKGRSHSLFQSSRAQSLYAKPR